MTSSCFLIDVSLFVSFRKFLRFICPFLFNMYYGLHKDRLTSTFIESNALHLSDLLFYMSDKNVTIDFTFYIFNRVLCVGSKDMNTRVYGAQHFKNLVVYSMGGHRDAIVGSFFEADSLDVSFVYKLYSYYSVTCLI